MVLTKMVTRLAIAIAGIMMAGAAMAQTYPTRPVRLIVPFPPGAASDFIARTLGQKLGEAWGQQIVVDNRPGAGGLIGGTAVAHAAPDGQTVSLVGQPHLTAALLSKDPPWDPFKDFVYIGNVASMPNVVVVGPGLPVSTAADLIRQVKANPGKFNVGTAGLGSTSHLSAEVFNAAAGLKSVVIPFKLLSDALAEMYGGRVHYYLFPLPAAMPALRDGKLKPVAVGGRKRAVALPDVPTLTESAMPGFVSESYFGLVGPAAIPRRIVVQFNTDANRILRTDEMRQRFEAGGAEPAPSTPEEFNKLMREEYARIGTILKDVGLKPQ
jgi:tripartite-type tricarboxylate transporter receptor subunit TctC